MPDFDVDFCYERRQEVIDYVNEKYGRDHVAQIVTLWYDGRPRRRARCGPRDGHDLPGRGPRGQAHPHGAEDDAEKRRWRSAPT